MKNIYKPTYVLEKVDFQEVIRNEGQHVKLICFYKADKHIIENPPDHTKLIDKVLKVLNGTGVCKIEITYLDNNLVKKGKDGQQI